MIDRQPDVADEIAFVINDGNDDYSYSPLENKQMQVDVFGRIILRDNCRFSDGSNSKKLTKGNYRIN